MDGPAAGFVLAGGKSRRMGADKALLPFGNSTLIEHVAGEIQAVTGSVTVVGNQRCYLASIPDLYRGMGPVGGVVTALSATTARWNLIVACDMPGIHRSFLQTLVDEALGSDSDCVVPVSAGAEHPLCAIYSRGCLDELRGELDRGEKRLRQAVRCLRVKYWPVSDGQIFENVNTPAEWSASQARRIAFVL